MKRSLSILSLLFLLFNTCGPEVKFLELQPAGRPNLAAIPNSMLGAYENQADSSVIIITRTSVAKEWRSSEFMPLDSIEKELKVKVCNDTLLRMSDGVILNVAVSPDSASARIKVLETLFELSDSQIVRSHRGYLFLNFQTKDDYWQVKVLKLKRGFLYFFDLVDIKEIEAIEDFTKVVAIKDTASDKNLEYHLNPTRKELRRILKGKVYNKSYRRVQ